MYSCVFESVGGSGDWTTETVTEQDVDARPRLIAAPLFVATSPNVHDCAAAHDTALSTLSCPSQRPMEKGRPGGGYENAHVMLVPTFVVVAASASPTCVPVGERSMIVRGMPQFESTGGRMNCARAQASESGVPRRSAAPTASRQGRTWVSDTLRLH